MSIFLQIILYVGIAVLLVQDELIAAALVVCIFTYYRSAVWLIPLAFLVDGYFNAFYTVPAFSIASIIWFGFSEFLKPRVRGYTTSL
jgi:hypothetical protein